MALTVAQFRKKLKADEKRLRSGKAPAGIGTCHNCNVPLQEAITGNRQVVVRGRTKNYCSDCYFEEMGRELDEHPIFVPRVRRG